MFDNNLTLYIPSVLAYLFISLLASILFLNVIFITHKIYLIVCNSIDINVEDDDDCESVIESGQDCDRVKKKGFVIEYSHEKSYLIVQSDGEKFIKYYENCSDILRIEDIRKDMNKIENPEDEEKEDSDGVNDILEEGFVFDTFFG